MCDSHLAAGSTTLDDRSDFLPANIGAQGRRFDNTRTIYGGSVADTSRLITADQAAGKVVIFDIPPGTPRARLPGRLLEPRRRSRTGQSRSDRRRSSRAVARRPANPGHYAQSARDSCDADQSSRRHSDPRR